MADLPLFQFTTQEDWYYEIPFLNADAAGAPLQLVDANGAPRVFEALVTPAQSGPTIVQPVATLTMGAGNGITFKDAAYTTLVFRLSKATALTFSRGEYTADILEVVSGERHLFMPVRIRYNEPSSILSFLSRMIGVTFSASRQPIITPVAIAGRQGIRGPGIFSGSRAPVAADGTDGDFWVNTSVAPRLFYGPKASGAWPAGAPFVGGTVDVPGLTQALASKATPADITAAIQAYDTALKNGAGPAYDTFKELQDLFAADESTAAALATLVGTKAAKGANADITSLGGTTAAPGVDIAFGSTTVPSAATVDLGALTTVKAAISGTTAITSFGTKPHAFRMLRFAGVLTLTHNATSLILPGAANIQTAVGDTAILTSDASGNWTCRHYQRAASDVVLRLVGTTPGSLMDGGDIRVVTAASKTDAIVSALIFG
ncbi:hypothetical protein G3T14_21780 [Methylobacterium sp. BTF04]|uniref:hypothetical protein n=1 Tax=Methylobacterium sp. BTF04 TaxID=2708300 RepID=UPI0013D19A94|nr:hypothetical protein [Methylobacterium sp. BTF04]NEU14713.1 hypothetical protein [Methylobacterium sp. BTF04]